jgi:hypothetical protein
MTTFSRPAAPTGVANARGRWRIPTVLLVVAFVVYAVTIAHAFLSLDVWSANFASWHLVRTGTPSLDGVHVPELTGARLRDVWLMDAHGHTVVARSPGVIAATLPAYVVWHPVTMTAVPGGLTAALLTAAAVVLFFQSIRDCVGDRQATMSALAFGFATPVWSVAANGLWPHTITVFGIAGMAWASSRDNWWLAGLFGGITLWGRLHALVIVALLGLLVSARRHDRDVVLRVGTASLAFLALMSVWTHWMYGSWKPTASYDTSAYVDHARGDYLDVVNQLGFWVSPDRGLLVWTPVIVVLLPALVRSWRALPDWSRALVWGGLTYTVLQGVLNRFSGGEAFYGYRLDLEMLACLAPALALSAGRSGPVARRLLGPVLTIQLVAIAMGATRDNYFVAPDEVWSHNAFLQAVAHVGVGGWLVVLLAAALGVLAARIYASASPAPGQRSP